MVLGNKKSSVEFCFIGFEGIPRSRATNGASIYVILISYKFISLV